MKLYGTLFASVVAAAATLAVAAGGGALANSNAEPEFQAVELTSGDLPSMMGGGYGRKRELIDVLAAKAAVGPLCSVDFGSFEQGPIAEQPKLIAALHAIGIESVDFVGWTIAGSYSDTVLDTGAKLLCPASINAASVMQEVGGQVMPEVDSRGQFIIRLNQKVTHLFLGVLVDADAGEPIVKVLRSGDEGAAVIDPALVVGGYADELISVGVAAALAGGEFDEVRVSTGAAGDVAAGTFCLRNVSVPCDQVKQIAAKRSVLHHDDDDDNSNDDGQNDDDDSVSGADQIAHTIQVTGDVTKTLETLGAGEGVGPLCSTPMNAFDAGFSFAQLPSRLPHNGVKSITFVGEVAPGATFALDDAADEIAIGDKAFCSVAAETGTVVVAQDTNQVFLQPAPANGMYVIELTAPVSVAYVEVCGNIDPVEVSVGLKGIMGPSEDVTIVGAGTAAADQRDMITVSSLDGVFDQIALGLTADGTSSDAFCICGIALPCDQLDKLD